MVVLANTFKSVNAPRSPESIMDSMPCAPSKTASAAGNSARPVSLSSSRLPTRSNSGAPNDRSSSWSAALVADWESGMLAAAALVVPRRAIA